MNKIVPDPPLPPLDPYPPAPDDTFFTAHTEVGNPTYDELHLFTVREGLNIDNALMHASELLACTSTTAYENADNFTGPQRSQAMTLYHLVNMAKALVDASLESRNRQGKRLSR